MENKRASMYIIEKIEELILNADLKVGDMLPPERTLCDKYHVSRTSLREALRALEVLGLVECRQGNGNYICKDFNLGFFNFLSIYCAIQNVDILDLYRVQMLIEIDQAETAIANIDENKLYKFRYVLDKFALSKDEESLVHHTTFHDLICDLIQNDAYTGLHVPITRIFKPYWNNILKLKNEGNSFISHEKLIAHHVQIVDALEKKDVEAFKSASISHYHFIYDNWELISASSKEIKS